MSTSFAKALATICLIAGFGSILASLAIWFSFKSEDAGHAERFGIFVGLWAPTFLILSHHLRQHERTAIAK
jgi:hypothetical protein